MATVCGFDFLGGRVHYGRHVTGTWFSIICFVCFLRLWSILSRSFEVCHLQGAVGEVCVLMLAGERGSDVSNPKIPFLNTLGPTVQYSAGLALRSLRPHLRI